jgi:NADH-quinone oxidoreductase subunit B/C/D
MNPRERQLPNDVPSRRSRWLGSNGSDVRRLPLAAAQALAYEHPVLGAVLGTPGLTLAATSVDRLLTWGSTNSLWMFPMATSCCAIEFMAAAASRVDLDRMGTILRGTPRQTDVMVIAGTITVKMAPRVKRLWEQMPEPKWAIAMGSCAISGDFYRNLYSVVPGVDLLVPVDVYVPGCPPNPEALMHGLLRLKEKVSLRRAGKFVPPEHPPAILDLTRPHVARMGDPARDPSVDRAQEDLALRATEPASHAVEAPPAVEDALPPDCVEGDAPREVEAVLRDEFGVTELPTDAAPAIPLDAHLRLARRLRSLGYQQLVYIVATHFPEQSAKAKPERFEVAYALRSVGAGSRIAAWRLLLAPGEAPPTLIGLFAGADWQEREQFDLLGVRFEGHPDLRRLLLPETWTGHPLRKDYAAEEPCPPWR